MWFYRADIFEECGVDVREVKTIDEFIAAGEKMQRNIECMHGKIIMYRLRDMIS